MNGDNMSGGAQVAPKQIFQTEKVIGTATDNSRMLMDSISLLEERLNPILRHPNSDTAGKDEKSESLVLVAEEIRKLGMGFEVANRRIRDILGRLEI